MPGPEQQIIYRNADGRELSYADLEDLPVAVDWNSIESDSVPVQAHEFHLVARNAGRKGDYADAIKLLAESSRLAPDWPYPMYDAAFACLLMGDFENALKYYERVDKMSPRGFLNTKAALDTLYKENKEEYPKGLYLAYLQIDGMQNKDDQLERLKELLETNPGFAPGWLSYATIEINEKLKNSAINRGLELDPDPETKGLLLVLKAISLLEENEIEEAVHILCELALDPKSTLTVELKAKTVLANLVKQTRTQ